ncbi:MAG: hypothetical protein R2939_02545 [Kofleriaceae bacterium]
MRTTLLVEPDRDLIDLWTGALRETGHDVVSAQVLAAGIEHLREGGVDVVVVDATTGAAELAPMIDALDRLPDAPPMILISARPDGPELSARIGAAGFLPMPCEPADLVREISRITGGDRRSSSQPALHVSGARTSSPRIPVAALVPPALAPTPADDDAPAFGDDEPTGPGFRPPE